MIAAQEMTVSELAEPFNMSLAAPPSISRCWSVLAFSIDPFREDTYLSSQSGRHEQGAGMVAILRAILDPAI